ncbi:hypothetical protein N7540_006258 [Penicillium herquei]|nr:hypothetical protein N7540_006258 [Penicillium herquei]
MTEVSASSNSPAALEDPLLKLDRSVIMKATEIFQQRFAMFSFLHGPTLIKIIHGDAPLDLRFSGIMALCARFIPELIHEYGNPLAASENFAAYLRHKITAQTVIGDDISMAQTLLLLSFHDWGSGKGGQSWIYNGMATRACFVTLARLSKSRFHGHAPLQTQVEEARRTMWSCLMVEAMLGCHDLRSLGFQSRLYQVPLPSSDEDFVFSILPETDLKYLEVLDLEVSDPPAIQKLDSKGQEINFTLIIQGFNIWSEVSRWASSSKRTQTPPASRWLSLQEDSFWRRSLLVLEDWRNGQSSLLHFSTTESHLPAFLSRRQGERYAFLNLIYYSTCISLHRECLPFIINKSTQQTGSAQTRPPFHQSLANGWQNSLEKLAGAACNTIHLMRELVNHGIDLQVPFTCYCVFNATTILVYAKKWPQIMSGSPSDVELFDWGVKWVSRASEIWEVARVWLETLMKIDSFHNGPERGISRLTAAGPQSPSCSRELEDSRSGGITPFIERNHSRPLELDEFQLPYQQDYAVSDDLSLIWDSLIAYPIHSMPSADLNFPSFDLITPHTDTG